MPPARTATLLVLLIAFAVRFHQLGAQSLWNDEGNSLRLAQHSPTDLIDAAGRDIHPPGYYLLLKAWIALAGTSEFGLRALSAFEGVLTVGVTLALGRRLFGRGAGILAGLLVALSPFAVYYSQEARMYAQLSLLSALSMALFVDWVRRLPHPLSSSPRVVDLTPRPLSTRGEGESTAREVPSPNTERGFRGEVKVWPWALTLGVCNAAGLYTHYSYPFTMLAQGAMLAAWMVWRWWIARHGEQPAASPRKHDLRAALTGYVALNLLTLTLFLPWLPTAWDQVTAWPRTGVALALGEQVRTVLAWITYGNTAGRVAWLRFLWPGLLAVAALWPARCPPGDLPERWRAGLPLLWAGIVIAALFASGAYREANLKFLLPAQVGAALLIGGGAQRLWPVPPSPASEGAANAPASRRRKINAVRRMLVVVCLFLVVVGQVQALDALYTDPAYARDDYRTMAALIAADPRPGDAIILDAPNQAEVFTYYYRGDAPIYALPRGLGGDDIQTRADVQAVIRDHRRLFVLFWGEDERDPHRVVQATLDEGAYPVSSRWFGHVRLAQYAVLGEPPTAPQTVTDARFGDHIALTGYTLSADAAQPGDVIGVTLFWTTDAPLNARYKVTVQLLSPGGMLVSQHDAEPGNNLALTTTWAPGATVIDTHGLVIPPDIASGQYTVVVGLYGIDTLSQRLPVTVDAEPVGDALTLEEVGVQ
jgi:mannosyltransferase